MYLGMASVGFSLRFPARGVRGMDAPERGDDVARVPWVLLLGSSAAAWFGQAGRGVPNFLTRTGNLCPACNLSSLGQSK